MLEKEYAHPDLIRDPIVLAQKCEEVTFPIGKEIRKAINKMKKVLHQIGNNRAYAIAAPQLGYNYRIFIINYSTPYYNWTETHINPEYKTTKYKDHRNHYSMEGCLSLPGNTYKVRRNSYIDLTYKTEAGFTRNKQYKSLLADIVQHEMDHLDGILICDKRVPPPRTT